LLGRGLDGPESLPRAQVWLISAVRHRAFGTRMFVPTSGVRLDDLNEPGSETSGAKEGFVPRRQFALSTPGSAQKRAQPGSEVFLSDPEAARPDGGQNVTRAPRGAHVAAADGRSSESRSALELDFSGCPRNDDRPSG
jgi:hypothetical protein